MNLTPKHTCNLIETFGILRDSANVKMNKCVECGLKVHSEDLRSQIDYQAGSMWSHSSDILELKTKVKKTEDYRRAQEIIRLFSMKEKKLTLLDFGCGQGTLLEELLFDFECSGIEIEKNAFNLANQKGLKVYSDENAIIEKKLKFDVLLLIHVIEHIHEPFEFINRIKEYLNVGGYLIIETPNANDALLELYKSEQFANFTFWSHHPILHTKNSLSIILSESGFQLKENTGVQRYGLANHLYWLSRGEPGGHVTFGDYFNQEIEKMYSQILIERSMSDTIWIVASLK